MTEDPTANRPERSRSGDPEAFAELFAAHEDDVLRVCRRMLGPTAAEDARSEVFLRARRSFDRFDASRPFRPWLLKIAGNHCLDQLRHRAAERRVFSYRDPTDADLESLHDDDSVSPLSRLIAGERRQELDRAIEELPLKYRLPLVLRYFGGYDYAGIAEALGVGQGQVGSLLFRAKRLLREAIRGSGRALRSAAREDSGDDGEGR